MKAYDSAYPGSMFEKPHGSYIKRDDATSLADALVEVIHTARDNCNDALDEKVQLERELEAAKQRELELLAVIEKMIEAANCVNHWHDWGKEDEGMVVSHDAVIHLLEVAASADVAIHGGDNSQALREHEAKVLEEAADWFDNEEYVVMSDDMSSAEDYAENQLRRMAEDRRKK